MKLALASLAVLALASLSTAQTGIKGSAHDFSADGWNPRSGEICAVCHIPHSEGRTAAQTGNGLLWGRSLSVVSYTMYTSPTLDGTTDAAPSGSTKLCLGCHDGSVALEHFGGTIAGGTNFVTGDDVVGAGGALQDEHPISITYVSGGATGMVLQTGNFGTKSYPITNILEGGKVQCRSCHDVHNKDVEAGAAKLLRLDNNVPATPSALCLACHDK